LGRNHVIGGKARFFGGVPEIKPSWRLGDLGVNQSILTTRDRPEIYLTPRSPSRQENVMKIGAAPFCKVLPSFPRLPVTPAEAGVVFDQSRYTHSTHSDPGLRRDGGIF